ncbi:MAG: 2-amino-4-hydroxy-6-hydroxymethyldihydropteridine diphosphokinase [Clostridium sp.]|nr:2-amino-4-hydroxy-6-hydroxymethyldihydropteridine diphosphokinase [Clostridium sp.]
MKTYSRVFIGIGSNTADRFEQISRAVEMLGTLLDDLRCSEVYQTRPLSGEGSDYANAVAMGLVDGETDAAALERRLKAYETDCGRIRSDKKHIPIDLDLVWFGDQLLRPAELRRAYFLKGYSQLFE